MTAAKVTTQALDQKGVLHIPMALALGIVLMTALGFWGILRQWRGLTSTQLRLDRCVGATALRIRNDLRSLDRDNRAILAARVGIAATMAFPPDDAPFRAALESLVLDQERIQLAWNLRRIQWGLSRGCDGVQDWAMPLSEFPFERPPPDVLGPGPLNWSLHPPTGRRLLAVQLSHRPRHARAIVQEGEGNHVISSNWSARFSSPEELLLGSSGP